MEETQMKDDAQSSRSEKMENLVRIQNLSVVVAARSHNPTILNPDFLKYNKIVPMDWELESNPICADPVAQVKFTNGISITAEMNKVVFSEQKSSKEPSDFITPEIATRISRLFLT